MDVWPDRRSDEIQESNPQQSVEGRLRNSVENQYQAGKSSSGQESSQRTGNSWVEILILGCGVAILILGCGIGLVFWLHQTQIQSQQATIAELNQKIGNLTTSLDQLSEGVYTKIVTFDVDLTKVQERVGLTRSQIDDARQLAEKVRSEKQLEVASLTSQLLTKADTENLSSFRETSNTKFGQIDQELSGVRTDINASREIIEKTREEHAALEMEHVALGLDLEKQGEKVATNGQGIQELIRRGAPERDYIEFSTRNKQRIALFGKQNKQRISVAGIALELRKAEHKKHRADVRLFFDNKWFHHNDVYVNTPLTFLVGPQNTSYELIISEVKKDHISGYIGLPKKSLKDTRAGLRTNWRLPFGVKIKPPKGSLENSRVGLRTNWRLPFQPKIRPSIGLAKESLEHYWAICRQDPSLPQCSKEWLSSVRVASR